MIGKSFLAVLVVLAATACTGPQIREPADVTSAKPPLVFALAERRVENESSPPAGGGFRDRRHSERLVEATTAFLEDRLEATGGLGWLEVTIEEARIIEEELEVEGGIRAVFVREPDRLLDAMIRVRIAVMGADGLEQSFAQAEVQRKRPILRNTSVITIDAEAERLIGDIVGQLDDVLTQAVRQHLNAHLAI